MAGDWIPMRMDLLDDPAVIAMAAALGLEEYAVVGRLLKLWSWANRHLKDGHAFVPDNWVDDYLGTPGFAAAMLDAGWLRTRSGGVLEFTSFDRWNSNGAKVRLGETLRKRAFRERRRQAAGQAGALIQGPETVPKVSRTNPGPEKRREEKKDPPTPRGGGVEEVPPFEDFLSEWVAAKLPGHDAPGGIRDTPTRRGYWQMRVADPWWRDNWLAGVRRLGRSAKARGFKPDFPRGVRVEDFLKPDGLVRVVEGEWDDDRPSAEGSRPPSPEEAGRRNRENLDRLSKPRAGDPLPLATAKKEPV